MKIQVAGKDIYMSYSFAGEGRFKIGNGKELQHYKYRVYVRYDGLKYSFTFNDSYMRWHDNEQTLREEDLRDALLANMTDAACWKDDEFEGLKKHQILGCKRAYEVTTQVFGADWDKIYNNLLEH